MRKSLERFTFFVLGGFVFLLGSLFTPFQEVRVDAQSDDFVDWIRCGRLEVIDEIGHPVLVLDVSNEGGGIVNVFGKGGWASLSANKHGGDVVVAGENGEGRLSVDENGARFFVQGEHGKSETRLSVDENGGVVSISNKAKQNVGQFSVSSVGSGVLKTIDTDGNETGSVP